MKRFLSFVLAVLVTIAILGYGVMSYITEQNEAVPGEAAMAAMQPTDAVDVSFDDWLVMTPKNSSPSRGVIVYAGANCDIRGYAPMMQALAEAGYLVVGPTWIFNYSITDVMRPTSKVDQIQAAYPEIDDWVLVGHSMGGATAGFYTNANADKLAGVVFWDSYPPEQASLENIDLPAVNIYRATLDGDPPEHFAAMRYAFPPDTVDVPVKGGIHMYFGSFIGGAYNEVWTPSISEAEQIEIVTRATVDGIAAMQ